MKIPILSNWRRQQRIRKYLFEDPNLSRKVVFIKEEENMWRTAWADEALQPMIDIEHK